MAVGSSFVNPSLTPIAICVLAGLCCSGPIDMGVADEFDGLVKGVGQKRDSEPLDPAADAALAEKVTDAALARRKKMVLRVGAAAEFMPWAKNPATQYPVVLCRLLQDPTDADAMAYIPKGMIRRGQGDMFGKSSLSRIYCQLGDMLTPEVRQALVKDVTTYPGFLTGGTENHVAMKRTAGYLFGEGMPEAKFCCDLTGKQLADVCRTFMREYGRAVYASSMVEYLSPIYHAVNTAPWLNVAEFAKDDQAKIMARAILDWMMADLAINSHHGIVLPPVQRAKGLMTDSYQLSYCRTHTQWSGWLYWGGGNTPDDEHAFEGKDIPVERLPTWMAVLHALSDWSPHPAIRNIGAKRVQTPYMLWQSRGNWACIEPSHLNDYGRKKLGGLHAVAPDPRYHIRSVYVARDYAMGASCRREEIMDPITRHAIPFAVVWRSRKPRNWLFVSSPFWYTARKKKDSGEPLGKDDWIGTSPFLQMAHWENASVLIFDIPARDPYEGKAGKGSKLYRSERTEACIQKAFVYVPESIEEKVQTPAGFFLREGGVYIAIRPLRPGARWDRTPHEGFQQLVLDGGLVGAAIEVGDKREFGSFAGFQEKVAGTKLDVSRLDSEKRVVYRSTRGHTIDIKHAPKGWIPEVSINGVRLDHERWPTCQSPYVTCRDRVLDVNDGRQGFTVDWRGDLPVYTYYDLVAGEKKVTRRERIENGRLRVE